MSYHNLSDLSLQAPPRTAGLQPLWWNAPLPGWGGNPEAAGPELVGVGSACMGVPGGCIGADGRQIYPPDMLGAADEPTLNFGHVALGASAGLLVGLLIGWVARAERGLRPNGKHRRNAAYRVHKRAAGRYVIRPSKSPKGPSSSDWARGVQRAHHKERWLSSRKRRSRAFQRSVERGRALRAARPV